MQRCGNSSFWEHLDGVIARAVKQMSAAKKIDPAIYWRCPIQDQIITELREHSKTHSSSELELLRALGVFDEVKAFDRNTVENRLKIRVLAALNDLDWLCLKAQSDSTGLFATPEFIKYVDRRAVPCSWIN